MDESAIDDSWVLLGNNTRSPISVYGSLMSDLSSPNITN